MQKLIQLLDDLRIPHVERGNEHCREGWVQVSCPFCPGGDHDFHLGINTDGAYCSCYRCGYHSFESLLKVAGGINRGAATELKKLAFPYSSRGGKSVAEIVYGKYDFKLPSSGKASESARALAYLQGRLFETTADAIERYDIRYTDMAYKYDHPSTEHPYKYSTSIVIPNRLDGIPVSFQCRSYLAGKSMYMTAKPEEEVFHHKHFLWGIDDVRCDSVIVVEGAFNAISIGAGAVHTHGCNFTKNQVDELATFRKVYIAFDMDRPGEIATKKLKNLLTHRTSVFTLEYGRFDKSVKDPNDLLRTPQGREELQGMRSLVQ